MYYGTISKKNLKGLGTETERSAIRSKKDQNFLKGLGTETERTSNEQEAHFFSGRG